MPPLFLSFMEQLSEDEKTFLSTEKDRVQRIQTVLEHPFIKEKFNNIQLLSGKNMEKSIQLREEGNGLFGLGKFTQALHRYTSAVAFAPVDKVDYSLALANRSACLQKLGEFERCIEDVKMAEDAGYPTDKLYKLKERRAQCLLGLGERKMAMKEFGIAEELLDKSTLSKESKSKFKSNIKNQLNAPVKTKEVTVKPTIPSEIRDVQTPHPNYPGMSKLAAVTYTPKRGRYVIATEDIPVGTVILSENPLSWSVEPDRTSTTCNFCMFPIRILVPCKGCISAGYCSTTCRDQAWNEHHSLECGTLGIVFASGLNSFSFLAIRAVCRSDPKEMFENKSEYLKASDSLSYQPCEDYTDRIYRSGDLKTGLSLQKESQFLEREDIILRVLVAAFLAKLLEKSKFGEIGMDNDDLCFLGSILFELLDVSPQNSHEIGLLQTPTKDKWSTLAEIKPLGGGLYPTASLFNHSCDPNIMRYNRGHLMVSVTCRKIKKGDEICDCYGLPWYAKPAEQRQRITSRFYKFTCACAPCKESWPLSDLLVKTTLSDLKTLRCECGSTVSRKLVDTTVKCACGKVNHVADIPLDRIQRLVDEVNVYMCTKLDWSRGLGCIEELQSIVGRYLSTPSLEYFLANISVWRSLWIQGGNKKVVKIL